MSADTHICTSESASSHDTSHRSNMDYCNTAELQYTTEITQPVVLPQNHQMHCTRASPRLVFTCRRSKSKVQGVMGWSGVRAFRSNNGWKIEGDWCGSCSLLI